MVVTLVILTIAAMLAVDYFLRRRAAGQGVRVLADPTETRAAPVLAWDDPAALLKVPEDVFLSPGHTWLRLGRTGEVRLGADRLPLRALGGVDRIEIALPGTRVRKGEPIVSMLRNRRLVRLVSPVDGQVTAVNADLLTDLSQLRGDPFRKGWLYSIRVENLANALREMLVAEEAAAWMKREVARLRDLLAGLGSTRDQAVTVLADGGVPHDGFAERLSEGEWNELAAELFGRPATVDSQV